MGSGCVPESDPIIFAAGQTVSPLGNELLNRTPVFATLTSVMNKRGSGQMADMTTTLTVNTSKVETSHVRLRKEFIFYLILPSSILQVILSYIIISPMCIELSSLLYM